MRFITLISTLVLIASCSEEKLINISDFKVQYQDHTHGHIEHVLDLDKAYQEGIKFPESDGEYISFEFKANLPGVDSVAYKLFYRNVDYMETDSINRQFYGGWGYGTESFHFARLSGKTIKDSIRIVGNPRNNRKYFGPLREPVLNVEKRVKRVLEAIENSADWKADISAKAQNYGISYHDQAILDALWVIKNDQGEGDTNARWKRNPRMGAYEFQLVAMPVETYHTLEEAEKNLSKKTIEQKYLNPFYCFEDKDGVVQIMSDLTISLRMDLNPTKGIYIDRLGMTGISQDLSQMSASCSSNLLTWQEAHWEQFFHSVNRDFYLKNVPITAVVDSSYSRVEYERNRKAFPEENRDSVHFEISSTPCATVALAENNEIELRNPAGVKEPVGVITRHGLTYGTYTLKVKFPDMLSPYHVWNGITNAFWLIFDSDQKWNERGYSHSGYLKKAQKKHEQEERHHHISYSEIDIEIVKAAEHWPLSSYGAGPVPKFDEPYNNHDILVSYTNWDMANRDPEHFVLGAEELENSQGKYWFHRWHEMYNAITCKQGFNHDSIFNQDYYYYQIEWAPDHITWRMGPEKDQLQVFGHMDDSMTSIPDNKMRAVVTQEFHATEWWPTAPFRQNDIPFPAKDLVGRVIELTIE